MNPEKEIPQKQYKQPTPYSDNLNKVIYNTLDQISYDLSEVIDIDSSPLWALDYIEDNVKYRILHY